MGRTVVRDRTVDSLEADIACPLSDGLFFLRACFNVFGNVLNVDGGVLEVAGL